jgi:hypothetical protein
MADNLPGRIGFSHEKTLLMFVIRDFVGSTPLANLTQTLTQDMEKIWTGLSKVSMSMSRVSRDIRSHSTFVIDPNRSM